MSERTLRVLDVGQCDMDHAAIAGLLTRRFGAAVERVHCADEAIERLQGSRYDLVLVNRIFDRDGDEGLALIRRLKADEPTKSTPVMLVSNYADAQDAAVAAGAARGFGKAALESPETAQVLSAWLARSS